MRAIDNFIFNMGGGIAIATAYLFVLGVVFIALSRVKAWIANTYERRFGWEARRRASDSGKALLAILLIGVPALLTIIGLFFAIVTALAR